jgi:hypothetical protein
MRLPTDDEIMRALCCGAECAVGSKNAGYCHRWDFASEAARIRALLDRYGEQAELRSLTNGLPFWTNVCTQRKRTCGLQGGSPGLALAV